MNIIINILRMHQVQTKQSSSKLNKKLAIAVAALSKAEKKPFNDIISEVPSEKVLAFHFGYGDQDDYDVLKRYLDNFGKHKLMIFPVKNYAQIEFPNIQQSLDLFSSLDHYERINFTHLKYQNKERPTFFFYQKENLQNTANDVPEASRTVDGIPGLELIHNFISEQEEMTIIQNLDQAEWSTMKQRRVQHYGYEFIYGQNTVNTDIPAEKPIPEYLITVKDRVSQLVHPQSEINQLTVNEYMPGMGIPPHFDVHPPFKEKFVSISLISDIVMSFKSFKGEEHHILLPRRSCVLFSGEVRYAWFHQIPARKVDKVGGETLFRQRRLSLTFRTIQPDLKCQCKYPFYCESQGYNPQTMRNQNPLLQAYLATVDQNGQRNDAKVCPNKTPEEIQLMEMNQGENAPTEIEKRYVYDIYDKIAPHFGQTRYKGWPKIEEFLRNLAPGSVVADVGCGNGKYLNTNDNLTMVGTDRSQNLLKLCLEKHPNQVFSADSLRLPLRDNLFDAAISIAVVHHFSNDALRRVAINELLRITRPGGLIMIYVWAMEQQEKQFNEQDVFVPWNLQFKYEDEKVISKDVQSEFKIDEAKKTVVYKRYYHVFKEGELLTLLSTIDGFKVRDHYFDHANWAVILEKN